MRREVKTVKEQELDEYLRDGWEFAYLKKNGDIMIVRDKEDEKHG